MSDGAVAERYARAIYELGQETGELSQVAAHLRSFSDAFSASRELRLVLTNPAVEDAKRAQLIGTLASRLGMAATATNAVRLLAQRRRLGVLGEIAARLATLADERAGILRVKVTSAKPLAESYYQELSQRIERSTGKKVQLERMEDPSLIAGVITQIGNNTVDGTVRGRLAEYQRQLLANS